MTAGVKDKPDMFLSYGRASFARLLPFLKPGFHHVRKQKQKPQPKAQACFYLSSESNHAQECVKVLLSKNIVDLAPTM